MDPTGWSVPSIRPLGATCGIGSRTWYRHAAGMPRAAFIATVIGVGVYLATGATFAPIFAGPALGMYAMASGTRLFADQPSSDRLESMMPPLRSWHRC
jgi:hypothetical protein